MIPRWLHRWYAFAFGYFWTPCPSCGREFGGHETLGGTLITHATATSRGGRILCAHCPADIWTDEATSQYAKAISDALSAA